MSTWTDPARARLRQYLDDNRRRAEASGADAEEVAADLERHIEAEIATLKLPVVTEEDLQRIVARVGVVPESEPHRSEPAPSYPKARRLVHGFRSGTLLFFGVILPLATLAIELATHICAGTFFDPIPTWIHVLLVASVPAANGVAWWLLWQDGRIPRWLWLANGVAVGSALFFALLYLPMSPFAVVGILFMGFGLLPLAPVLSLVAALRLRRHLRRRQAEHNAHLPRGWWWAFGLPLLGLALFAAIGPLTRHWIEMAGSESPETSLRAIRWLRRVGSEQVMLKECYGRVNRLNQEFFNSRRTDPALAQRVFYRVTGRAFNAVPPPLSKYQRGAQDLFNEFEFDGALGGDAVAGQVKGLSLQQSRMDGLCHAAEGWGYLEWTMEFRNDHPQRQREARAQVQLPPGAVVSRLTLWVNGEPREAAFAGRGEVREAYQQVAVRQQRDPVLVTTSGPDRVLVQCFPIPTQGGTMKIRLGITMPLLIEETNTTVLKLPQIIERNFRVSESLEHNFWLESQTPAQANFARLTFDGAGTSGAKGVRGQIPDAALHSDQAVLRFSAAPRSQPVRALDAKSGDGRVITQMLTPVAPKLPSRIAIVLDGSEDMTAAFPRIARALDGVPPVELSIWLARDGVEQIFDSQWMRSPSSTVASLHGVGGQDDLPALLQAWEWATAKPGSVVLWIHGPQPVLLGNIEALQQRLDWKTGAEAPVIIDAAVRAGPNRITETLAGNLALVALPRTGSIGRDLERLLAGWVGRAPQFAFTRTAQPPKPGGDEPKGSQHIVRLWAAEQVKELLRARRTAEAVALAGQQQLVTAVSGAVVLETRQQYAATGLTPADPLSVPTVPEPGTRALIVLGLLLLLGRNCLRRMAG